MVWGREKPGKTLNTVYNTARPKEKAVQNHQKTSKNSKTMTPLTPLNPFRTLLNGLNPPINPF